MNYWTHTIALLVQSCRVVVIEGFLTWNEVMDVRRCSTAYLLRALWRLANFTTTTTLCNSRVHVQLLLLSDTTCCCVFYCFFVFIFIFLAAVTMWISPLWDNKGRSNLNYPAIQFSAQLYVYSLYLCIPQVWKGKTTKITASWKTGFGNTSRYY